MRYYIRCTGLNRFAGGGTHKWRRITLIKDMIAYVGDPKNKWGVILLNDSEDHPNLEFRCGVWPNTKPCKLQDVLKANNDQTQQ